MAYAVKLKPTEDFQTLFQRGSVARVAFLQSLSSEKLFLRAPIILSVESSQKGILVSNSDFELWGCGDTEGEAISDFTRSLEELYFALKNCKDKLSKNLTAKLQSLEGFVSEK